MTADEWDANNDPDDLLDAAKAAKLLPARKARLFACGCFRLVWNQIKTNDIRRAVEMSEARADRQISDRELEEFRFPATNPADDITNWLAISIQSLAIPNVNPSYVAFSVRTSTENDRYRHARRGIPCQSQADLVREVVNNPFRSLSFEPRWRTSDVVDVARGIYEARAFERMPILADALMDAGCEDERIIAHCRAETLHVRGCWVVDMAMDQK